MTELTEDEKKKGQRVLQLRLRLGITQTEFGTKLTRNGKPVSQNYLSAIEQGRKKLGDDVQSRIEAAFNVRRQWLDEGVGAISTDDATQPMTEQQLRLKSALAAITLPTMKTRGGGNLTWVAARERGVFLRGNAESNMNLRKTPFPVLTDNAWAFEIADSSMLPMFTPGSWIICTLMDSPLNMVNGTVYGIQTTDHLIVVEYAGRTDEHFRFRTTGNGDITELDQADLLGTYHIEFKLAKP